MCFLCLSSVFASRPECPMTQVRASFEQPSHIATVVSTALPTALFRPYLPSDQPSIVSAIVRSTFL